MNLWYVLGLMRVLERVDQQQQKSKELLILSNIAANVAQTITDVYSVVDRDTRPPSVSR